MKATANKKQPSKPFWQVLAWDAVVLLFFVVVLNRLVVQAIDSGSILSYFLATLVFVLAMHRSVVIIRKTYAHICGR
ncbi:MAG TPA: hypothetical protein VLF91_01400 [Candidatus Saccharimonadales bacterium]|nr:hypothetical protein [Candidatus Saccharimonadales bacterium]